MISLPPGFDYLQLMHDFFAFATPFIAISGLFAAAYLVKRVIRGAA